MSKCSLKFINNGYKLFKYPTINGTQIILQKQFASQIAHFLYQQEMLRVTRMVTTSRAVQRSSGGPKNKSEKSKKSDAKVGKEFDNIGLKVGKFYGGMLKLSRKDLAKIKSKK